ncbi:metallophosphoesterase family protein [Mycobacterium sp. 050134]|uniref:metallophosphoesterase family protein n=1 Tax=Mycobacterium sp. 050134 TaxID=3096111 RepID=UPI002EDA5DBF
MLSRDFLTSWLRPVQEELQSLVDETKDPDGSLRAAISAIRELPDEGSPGQPDDGEIDTRRGRRRGGAEPPSLDAQSYFCRDPVMSLLQSALDELIEERRADLIKVEERPASGGRRGSSLPAVTDRSIGISGLRVDSTRRLLGPFEQSDIRWVAEVGIAKALALFRDRHEFNPRPAGPIRLADNARIVMVGDWGSGLPRAQRVAKHMRNTITEGLTQGRQVHALHLGDVYYSGFPREYTNRFLKYWPVDTEQAGSVYSWSLNGNHDMYSGGHGYFETLLADPRFACQQRSSWFSIENDHWRIVGLDTAWDEKGIHDPRRERGLAAPQPETLSAWAAQDDRPFMLLSHHQLFSGWETPGPYLRDILKPLLDAGRIRAWFWGHEHKCVVHRPYAGVEYGRCVGHGGVPVYAIGSPKHQLPGIDWVEQRAIDGFVERWALFGFAVLDFDGPSVRVSYIDEFGQLAHEESFDAR